MDRMLHNPYSEHHHKVREPTTPYSEAIPNGLAIGKQIFIRGVLLPNADWFSFNLEGGGNTVLHVNPRFNQNCIVRNSKIGAWGPEERHGSFPFSHNGTFEIIILVEEDKYRIAINGKHWCDYQHRVSFQEVTHLSIKGDLQIQKITYSGGFNANHKHVNKPSLPFCTDFQPKKGTIIQIRGDVPNHSGRFEIDVQDGPGVQPGNMQLHFNPRFDDPHTPEPVVVRTNRHCGGWGNEERHGGSPFRRGESFEIIILVEDSEFKVAVNGRHFTEFQHRTDFHEGNHISIAGDVNIHLVNIF